MHKKRKTPYRILRLRSGDDIIAKIVGKKGNNFILERPMQMKSATIFEGNIQREIVCFRNWLQYTDDDKTNIPSDWVATFLTPQEEISDLYEHEKSKEDKLRIEMERLENAEPSDKLSVLQNIMKMIKEQKQSEEEPNPKQPDLKDIVEPGSIIMNLAIPPAIFFEIMSNGFLENFDFEHILGGSEDEEIDNWEPPQDINNPQYGNRMDDWSPDLSDYLY
jgi:hypothetical protein